MKILMSSLVCSLLTISSLHAAISTTTLSEIREKVVELHIVHKPEVEATHFKKNKSARVEELEGSRGYSVCSGAFITDTGDILTARHCATDIESIDVTTFDQRVYRASVVAVSDRHDLALLHIDRYNTSYFKLQQTEQGAVVYTFGSPLMITGTLATGIVAKIEGDLTLVDLSVLPGNSGGPLINEDGNLVGITTAGFIVFLGMTHLNVAQGSDAIWFFLTSLAHGR